MANLPEQPLWEEGIYQLETSDPVLAGPDGIDNRQATQLGNRTAYLKDQVDGVKESLGAADPLNQYLLRKDVAAQSGPLAWLGAAAGTANSLTLGLKHAEATLTAYAAGQRFQFKATASNTGPVTAKIGALAAVAVKKSEGGGLVDLVGGDIRAGALYDLNYDGTYFQLGGGVGAGKAFERFSFEASVGQSVFPVPHTVGNVIVMRNGREVSEFLSDGQTVTLQQPCDFGESVQILAFSSFQSANTYTKAEVDALLTASAGLPVGTMLPFPKGTVPAGFLEVDGSLQSAAVYPDLAAYLGTTFNTGGEAAGYFRLPESRGEFLRGWDHGRGVDAGRTLGSGQLDATQNITGKLTFRGFAPVSSGSPYTADGPFSLGVATGGSSPYRANLVAEVTPQDVVTFDASKVARTATETRPRNLAVMWCIKAWNAPVNQGQVDIAALAPLAAQATEIKLGTAKVATQDQAKAGAADDVIVTPKKMRWGFAWSFTPNGYIIFPDWLMGFVLVWGFIAGAAGARNISFPTAFPTECLGLMLTGQATQTVAAEYNDQWINSYTKDGAVIYAESTQTVRYFGFGN